MTAIEELVQAANKLCDNLDSLAQNDKKFTIDFCMTCERYSWEVYRMMNDLQQIKELYG